MPIFSSLDFSQAGGLLMFAVAFLAAVFVAVWISMTIWANRDIRQRSRDPVTQGLATAVVALLNIPGLLIYLILRPAETLAEQYQRALEEEALLQEIENRSLCPGCSRPTQEGWRVCPYCQTKLKKGCESCGALLELAWTICPYCEHPTGRGENTPERRRAAQPSNAPSSAAAPFKSYLDE